MIRLFFFYFVYKKYFIKNEYTRCIHLIYQCIHAIIKVIKDVYKKGFRKYFM